MGRKISIAIMVLVFLAGLGSFLYPYARGAFIEREMQENAEDFHSRVEIQPTTEKNSTVIIDTTEPTEEQLYPDLWADMTVYNETIYAEGQSGLSSAYDYQKPSFTLKDYGLEQFKASKPSELSGGMRQRVALIRTLALNPGLLLLDEPFSALDYQTRLNVSDDIYSILRKKKKSAILVTHDISEAISFCDRIIVLTHRPGTVKEIIEIHLTLDNKTPLKARSAKEFHNYFNHLWGDLNDPAD